MDFGRRPGPPLRKVSGSASGAGGGRADRGRPGRTVRVGGKEFGRKAGRLTKGRKKTQRRKTTRTRKPK